MGGGTAAGKNVGRLEILSGGISLAILTNRAVARALIGGGGGIFIYSYARRISFEISCF